MIKQEDEFVSGSVSVYDDEFMRLQFTITQGSWECELDYTAR